MQGVRNMQTSRFKTKVLVKVSLLSAIAFILMFLEMPIPGLFPEFLKMDISDMPAIIAGLSMGPLAGIGVEIVKNFLHWCTASATGGIGEIANIVVGSAFVVGTSLVYRHINSKKGLILSFAVGTITMVVVGSLMNYLVLLPFYGQLMGMDAILGLGKAINPNVSNLEQFVLWFIAPFNLIKGIVISVLCIPIFKKMDKILRNN